jgi:hypothetical protein
MTNLLIKHKYITSILLAALVICCVGLAGGKVFADTYYPPEWAGDPYFVPTYLSNGAPGSLNNCPGVPHTWTGLWAAPYYLTPSYGQTEDDILLEGATYVCPGVSYSVNDNVKIDSMATAYDPYNAFSFGAKRTMNFGNVARGTFSGVDSLTYKVDLTALPASGCYYPVVDFNVSDNPGGGGKSTGTGSGTLTICVDIPAPNLSCDLLENSVGSNLDGSTINQGTTVTLDYPFTNFGNAPATVWNAGLASNYVIWDQITYPGGGVGAPYPINATPNYVPGGASLNAYQTFTFTQAGTYSFHWYTTNDWSPGTGGNGSCTTTINVVPPPPDFVCQGGTNDGLTSYPGIVVAGQSFYVTMPANNIQPYSVATFQSNAISAYSVKDPSGTQMAGGPGNPSPNPEYGVGTVTLTSSTITNPVPGTWTVSWLVTAAGGTASCSATVNVFTVSDPYIAAWGGDVIAGSEFNNGTGPGACPSSTDNPPDPAGYYPSQNAGIIGLGGTTNAAAEAYAAIEGFDSNYNSPGGSFTAMTFANVTNIYGNIGDFGYAPCAPSYDLPSSAPALSPTVTWPGPGSGPTVEYWSGGGTLNTTPETIWPGEQLTIYVNSGTNVNIDANISYDNTAYTKASDIPSFTLVALGGNINVSSATTELDGTYVAKPIISLANNYVNFGGTIRDCTQPDGTAYPSPLPSGAYTNYDPACFSQLYVRGSFVARQIAFDRIYDPTTTNGGLPANYNGSDTPTATAAAEVFEYGPAQWISTPATSSINDNYYDSITSLPPIL